MRAQLAAALRPTVTAGAVLGILSAIGLVLAMAGLFSVVNHAAKSRTLEFGIRIALGSTTRRIVDLTLRHGLSVVSIGCLIGALISIAVTVLLTPFSAAGQGPVDIPVLIATVVAVGGVSLSASLWPAIRAAHADPLVALRSE
jgi:ABC-type antimicrobial peptide transport system permease subunit